MKALDKRKSHHLLLLKVLKDLFLRQIPTFTLAVLPSTRYIAFIAAAVAAPEADRHDVLFVDVVRVVARESVLELC